MAPTRIEPTLLISRDEITAHISMSDVLQTVEDVYRGHGRDEVIMPEKLTMDLRPAGIDSHNHAMPAYVPSIDAAGIKWVSGYPDNPREHGLPYIQALVILQNPRTGTPIAILEGSAITNLRTGAAAGVFAKYFARPESTSVAIIGAGMQSRFSLEALDQVFKLRNVNVYDVSDLAASRYVDEMSTKLGLQVQAAANIESAVRGSDIVVTATTANAPLVNEEWLKPGSTSVSIGSYQEFADEAVLSMDKIVVDSWAQCAHRGELRRLAESGQIERSQIFAEIGETVTGRRPGREDERERILAVPIGLGTLDVAVGKLVYDRVREANGGTTFQFVT